MTTSAATLGRQLAQAVLRAIQQELYDVDEVIRLCLVALLTDGHVLLEANPGLGKTQLVKALGAALALRWGRIQFTPDLMPADITGTYMPDPKAGAAGGLTFRAGPVFAALLLADEINRATPKTQSAMLEAMAERQVTVLGETYLLPDHDQNPKDPTPRPFVVLATQNPIDQEGTYTLPEAQADRFMFKILMPLPSVGTLARIVAKESSPRGTNGTTGATRAVLESEEQARRLYAQVRDEILRQDTLPALDVHIVNLIAATNGQFSELSGLGNDDRRWLEQYIPMLLSYGLGPRAAIALMRGAKAWTHLFSPDAANRVSADGVALARVVIPTLRHRIHLEPDWAAIYGEARATFRQPVPTDESVLLECLIADLCQRTAPSDRAFGVEYHRSVGTTLLDVLEHRRC